MNVTELLRQQHTELRALLQEATAAVDPAGCRPMLRRIAQAIDVHTKIEAEILYPAVRRLRTESAEELFLTSLEEHHVVHVLTAALLLASHERVGEALVALEKTVCEHIEQEEQRVFGLVEQLGHDEQRRLGERLHACATRLLHQQLDGS
jgi:hypothetical protein